MLDVGGAFGARTAPFSEYPVLMLLAKRLKRPVKWLSTRSKIFSPTIMGVRCRCAVSLPTTPMEKSWRSAPVAV